MSRLKGTEMPETTEPQSEFDALLDTLERYPIAMKNAVAIAGDRLPDVTGIMHSNAAQIRDMKRLAQSELEDGESGKRWAVVIDPKNDYTFNTPALFQAFLSEWEGSFTDLLLHLIASDVVRLEWQLTKTKNMATAMGVDITISGKPVDDTSDAEIGKVKGKGYPSYRPINEEKDGETN
jgi:hypothetical protein